MGSRPTPSRRYFGANSISGQSFNGKPKATECQNKVAFGLPLND
jgi:hypothetical protein